MVALLDELKPVDSEIRFGLSSPLFLISTISIYLLFVYKIGPELMKNRQPYKLKNFVTFYNVIQVLVCVYLVNKIWQLASWDIFNFSKCIIYEANTPGRLTFDNLTYLTFWLKVFELTDTVVFVLRKKRNQVTYLHVFHHASTITLFYLLLMYYRGIGALFPIFLNSWVHVIMYSYYLFSNVFGPGVMKHLIYIKKSITIIQMIQFVFILAQAMIMWNNCQVPLIVRSYYYVVVSVIFYGFYDFYKKTYLKKSKNDNLSK